MGLLTSVQILISTPSYADQACQNAGMISSKLIRDICWECVFPIIVSMGTISGSARSSTVPDGAAQKPLCMCSDNNDVPKPGVQTSLWEPYRAVEFVRQSGCSQVLNGMRFPFDKLNQGTGVKQSASARAENEGHGLSFRHYHYYSFPAMYMLDMFLPMNCNPGGYVDLDAMYFSELDPTWNHDEIAFFTHPEAALFATPLTAVSCIPDAFAAGFNKPMKDLYWCAGAWGAIFPTSGHVTAPRSILGSTSLMTARVLYQLHRRGMEWRSMGDDAMCGGRISPYLPKTQYRFSLFWPVPETDDNHCFGQSDLHWGSGRVIPAVGGHLN